MEACGVGGKAGKAVALGACGFAGVSLGGFAVWALGGRWFYRHGGEAALYAACAAVFAGLAGLLLHPLLRGPHRVWRFYRAFVPAFLAYSVAWSVCWFVLKAGKGEWLGSFVGCAVFALVLRPLLGSNAPLGKVILVLFLGHSAGYFSGGFFFLSKTGAQLFSSLPRAQAALAGKLLWGFLYGLGFGAGIGYAFCQFQQGRGGLREDSVAESNKAA